MKNTAVKKDEFGNHVCNGHAQGFARWHSRVDEIDKVVNRMDSFFFGNAERGIEGFVQKDVKFKTRMDIYMKIIIFVCSALFIAIIPLVIKSFWKGVP